MLPSRLSSVESETLPCTETEACNGLEARRHHDLACPTPVLGLLTLQPFIRCTIGTRACSMSDCRFALGMICYALHYCFLCRQMHEWVTTP
jgi:hypothetical protein